MEAKYSCSLRIDDLVGHDSKVWCNIVVKVSLNALEDVGINSGVTVFKSSLVSISASGKKKIPAFVRVTKLDTLSSSMRTSTATHRLDGTNSPATSRVNQTGVGSPGFVTVRFYHFCKRSKSLTEARRARRQSDSFNGDGTEFDVRSPGIRKLEEHGFQVLC